MDGQTNYTYQPGTPDGAIRKVDNARSEAFFAATREEHQPNSRTQFDNILSYSMSKGGDHLLKGGVQFARLYYESDYSVQRRPLRRVQQQRAGAGAPVQHPGRPRRTSPTCSGFFPQDSWSMNRLTLNLGAALRPLHRHPARSVGAGRRGSPRPAASRSRTCSSRTSSCGAPARPTTCSATARRPSRPLQPLRPADRHRPGHPGQPADRRQPHLPVDRPERRRPLPGGGGERRAVHAVQRRRLDLLRPRRRLAVLGRVHRRRRAAAARRHARRRDVLLPHQPRPARRPQPGPSRPAPTRRSRLTAPTARAARSPTRSRRR